MALLRDERPDTPRRVRTPSDFGDLLQVTLVVESDIHDKVRQRLALIRRVFRRIAESEQAEDARSALFCFHMLFDLY